MSALWEMSATDAVDRLRRRQVSPLEMVEAAAERIAAVEPKVNALPIRFLDAAREQARDFRADGRDFMVFRGKARNTITAVRRPIEDGIEVQYLGEPVGMGPVRLDDTSGRTFDHWDRFLLPSIAQVEYAVPGWFRVVNTILQLPLGPFRTRAWFVVRFSSPLPAPLVRTVVHLQGRRILGQDAEALARQTQRTRELGGERYANTELDLLGTTIWRLLRSAERAEQPDGADLPPVSVGERRVTFEA